MFYFVLVVFVGPMDIGRRDIELASVLAPVASVATSFVSECIFLSMSKQWHGHGLQQAYTRKWSTRLVDMAGRPLWCQP